ncbi:hypothetical protein D3C73_1482630 [compost metagenome]
MQAVRVFVQVAGENELVGLSLLDQHFQPGADFLRAADHRQPQEITDGFFLMRQP